MIRSNAVYGSVYLGLLNVESVGTLIVKNGEVRMKRFAAVRS